MAQVVLSWHWPWNAGPPVTTSLVLGLQMHATIPNHYDIFYIDSDI